MRTIDKSLAFDDLNLQHGIATAARTQWKRKHVVLHNYLRCTEHDDESVKLDNNKTQLHIYRVVESESVAV
jgi:hypothetical protein